MQILQYAAACELAVSSNWQNTDVAPEGTHHLADGEPLYAARFQEVLAFRAPGLAPVRDGSGAYHIDTSGRPAYSRRFRRTFGFYEGRAAVEDADGAYVVDAQGNALDAGRYRWCGNFQERRCTVRDARGEYFHLEAGGAPAYEARWKYAGDFREGCAVVLAADGLHRHIDARGNFFGSWAFLELDVFHKGFARARDDGGWFHLRRDGRPNYRRRFANIEPYYNGQARCEDFDGGLLVIDENGAPLLRLREPRRLSPADGLQIGPFQVSATDVLRRRAWGTIRGARDLQGRAFISKSTRATHDREHEVLIALDGHRCVPKVAGRVRTGDSDWLFLERRAGEELGSRNRCTPRTEAAALQIADALLDVCEHLHPRGFVHTDLHPGNILEIGGEVTVLDFEHAVQLDAAGRWCGELNWGVWEFVPPEQLADFTVLDATADVYAVAVLLAYLIRGRVPFSFPVMATYRAGGWNAVRARFLELRSTPQLEGISPQLRPVIERALSLAPEARPSASELRSRLREVRGG